MNPTGIAKLRPTLYCVMPYQAFEAAGFEQDCETMFFSTLTL